MNASRRFGSVTEFIDGAVLLILLVAIVAVTNFDLISAQPIDAHAAIAPSREGGGWMDAGASAPRATRTGVAGWMDAGASAPRATHVRVAGWVDAGASAPRATRVKVAGWMDAGASAPAPERTELAVVQLGASRQ